MLAQQVRGFLQQNRVRLGDVALFATGAGRGAGAVIAQMTTLLEERQPATSGPRATVRLCG